MITREMIQTEPLDSIVWILLQEYTRLKRQALELSCYESVVLYDKYRDLLIELIRKL
jgi:hypothetical protein